MPIDAVCAAAKDAPYTGQAGVNALEPQCRAERVYEYGVRCGRGPSRRASFADACRSK